MTNRGRKNIASDGAKTRFKKGSSGNPSGKSKAQVSMEAMLKDYAEKYGEDVLKKLIDEAIYKKWTNTHALLWLADRLFGKAKDILEIKGAVPVAATINVTREQMEAVNALLGEIEPAPEN